MADGCKQGCKPGGACRWTGCKNAEPCDCPSALGYRFHRMPCRRTGEIEALSLPPAPRDYDRLYEIEDSERFDD